MGRPREHDLDELLDHAKRLWVDGGMAGVTIRRLSSVSGVSNGAIYNAFGSRDNLLARVWAREAEEFLAFQSEEVEAALEAGEAHAAVVAAALAPSNYAYRDGAGSRLLLAVALDDLAGSDVGATERQHLHLLRRSLDDLVNRLAREVWNSTDPDAATLIRFCLVELPSALLLTTRDRMTDPLARAALERAVRGILAGSPGVHSRSR